MLILSCAVVQSTFSLGRITKSGAVFDKAKLSWMNGEQGTVFELLELLTPCPVPTNLLVALCITWLPSVSQVSTCGPSRMRS